MRSRAMGGLLLALVCLWGTQTADAAVRRERANMTRRVVRAEPEAPRNSGRRVATHAPAVVLATPVVVYAFSAPPAAAEVGVARAPVPAPGRVEVSDQAVEVAVPLVVLSPVAAPFVAAPLVARICLDCHAGAAPKGGLSLERLSRVPLAERLAAIRRVLSEDPAARMPPAGRLSAQERLGLLRELCD